MVILYQNIYQNSSFPFFSMKLAKRYADLAAQSVSMTKLFSLQPISLNSVKVSFHKQP